MKFTTPRIEFDSSGAAGILTHRTRIIQYSNAGDPIMSSRNSDIEVLRGIAVIYVVVFHAYGNLIPWRSPELNALFVNFGGDSGVDLFFVISGFVIARTLIPKLDACTDRQQFRVTSLAFWIRRYWRLLPTAWLWIGIVLLCSVFSLPPALLAHSKPTLRAA